MPAQPLGDLIVTLKLDDSLYKKQLLDALAVSQQAFQKVTAPATAASEAIRKVGAQSKISTKSLSDLTFTVNDGNARFGIMANTVSGLSSTLHVLTGEAGFLVVEMGRSALYLGRATTAAGGLAQGLEVLTLTVDAFLVSISKWIIPITVVTSAFLALRWLLNSNADALETLTKATDKSAESFEKLLVKMRAIRGENPDEDLRASLQKELGVSKIKDPGDRQALDKSIEAQILLKHLVDDETTAKKALEDADKKAAADKASRLKSLADAQVEQTRREFFAFYESRDAELESQHEVFEMKKKWRKEDLDDAFKSSERIAKIKRDEEMATAVAIQKAKIKHGLIRESSTLFGVERKLAEFEEMATARRKALDEKESFGIGTQKAGGFRFGTGPVGSVIGEQSEQHNTTKAVIDLEKTVEREFRGFITRLVGDGAGVDSQPYSFGFTLGPQ